MLLEALMLGGLAANAAFALEPALRGMALGERVTDSRAFTISLAAVGPEVTIVSLEAPEELEAGEVPTVRVTVEHTRTRPEWVFARIRDADTGEVVCPMKRTYMVTAGRQNFTFSGVAPRGDWGKVMPERDWNLMMEVGLWWL